MTEERLSAASRPESQGRLMLWVSPLKRGAEPLEVPVRINSLSATGAILESLAEDGGDRLLPLVGRPGSIHLSGGEVAGIREVPGRIAWTRAAGPRGGGSLLGFALQESDLEVRKLLEDHLGAFPRDLKNLWDSWDALHHRRPLPGAEQAVYLVGAGALAAGSTLYLAGPESLRLYGSIMALYGCVTLAARSLWAMWRTRAVSR
jgi:hypothetical protein